MFLHPRRTVVLALAAIGAIAGCRKVVRTEPSGSAPAVAASARLVTWTPAEDGAWTMPAKDYANTRYSRLEGITTTNAKDLRLLWTKRTGVERGHEAAPLFVEDTIYVTTPYPNHLIAFDLAGNRRWTYEAPVLPAAQGVACCDVVNRGAVFDRGRLFFNTLDAQTIAVDARTGKEIWRTKLGEINRGETMTMAPLVVKGKVLVGNSGGELGVRGWLTALDEDTGTIAWRAWSTGPDSDVRIGADFHPFYASDRGADLGVTSWPPEQWKVGGGTVWGFVSYDPELDLLYYGTANPGPWSHSLRPGDNKWTAGVFARRPDDGRAIWFDQYNPHDLYDHDGVNEHVLVDLDWSGTPRKVLLHVERNGYLYVIDRTTGEMLSATPYVNVTATTGIDLSTSRPKHVKALEPAIGKVTHDICPAAPGGKDWQPSAFSPRTGLLYVPHQNICMDEEDTEVSYIAGTPYVGANVRYKVGPEGKRGRFTAWDPVKAAPRWKLEEEFPVWSGALVTAGDVVFYGTMDGWFKALDARTGTELWKFKTESGVISQPVTFRAPDGKQYVAVLDGVGGWSGAVVAGDLDPSDQGVALGFGYLMADLKKATKRGGSIYVFGVGP